MRTDRLVDDFERLRSVLGEAQRRLDDEVSGRHELAERLAAARDLIERLRSDGDELAGAVGTLEADTGRTSEVVGEHGPRIDDLCDRSERQGRSLDHARADLDRTLVDLDQARADLAELRTTSTALARVVLRKDGRERPA